MRAQKSPPPARLLALLLALLAIQTVSAITWDEERLQWLVVTKPGQQQVQLNCTSEHIYPFTLLNDSAQIGAPGSHVKRVWWVLPSQRLINASYDDEHLRVVDGGVGLLVKQPDVVDVHGLYHCAVEANTQVNETDVDQGSTTVYYYKRGLNLYGADVYGGSTWEKYKRNTLIGCLTAGTFLAIIAGYALLNRLGLLARCGGGGGSSVNAVDILEDNGGPAPTAAAAAVAKAEETELKSATASAAVSVQHSRASVRSRRSEKPADGSAEETAA